MGGHGESKHSGILETLETALRRDAWPNNWDEDYIENQARASMWRLLDYDPTAAVEADVVSEKVLTHFLSLRMAYPHTFDWLTERESYLFTYLEAHRNDVTMPLGQLTNLQFQKLRAAVHAAL